MEHDDSFQPLSQTETEVRELLGLFSAPSFVRRGQDTEYAIKRLHVRLKHDRHEMQDMIRTRLRQWSTSAEGPNAESRIFRNSLQPLWTLTQAKEPAWTDRPVSDRRLRAIGRDLIASVERFNRRWSKTLETLETSTVNRLIDQYNRNYLLEKECTMGSSRLAARHYRPYPRVDLPWLLEQYPLLPVPELLG